MLKKRPLKVPAQPSSGVLGVAAAEVQSQRENATPWAINHRTGSGLLPLRPWLSRPAAPAGSGAAHAPVQRLQVELLGCLGGNKFHGRTLYRLRNRFAVAEVIL
jgi:hypothetical protein